MTPWEVLRESFSAGKEMLLKHWLKEHHSFREVGCLAILSPAVMQDTGNVPDEFRDAAIEIISLWKVP